MSDDWNLTPGTRLTHFYDTVAPLLADFTKTEIALGSLMLVYMSITENEKRSPSEMLEFCRLQYAKLTGSETIVQRIQ